MKESYNKRLNIFIRRVQEDNNNVWEKREKTIEKFQDFLRYLQILQEPYGNPLN